MPIRFYCPLGHRLVVPDERAGKKGRCPECHQRVYVPVAEPQVRRGARQSLDERGIGLDETASISPEVLDAPQASVRVKARPEAAGKAPGAAMPQAAPEPLDFKDPMALALDEITAMGRPPAVIMYEHNELQESQAPGSSLLPPMVRGSETRLARQTASAASPAAAAPSPAIASPAMPGRPPAMAPAASSPPAPRASPRLPAGTAGPAATVPQTGALSRHRGWIRSATVEEISRASQPESTRLQMAYLLAGSLLALSLMASWPALTHFRQNADADWVVIVLLMSVGQLLYVVWLLSLPDWTTLRVGMVLCALCAAAYAAALSIVIATPVTHSVVLGLTDVRSRAGLWSALLCGLMCVVCYGFGREASAWHDEL
ncbi:MAG TPA: hypothetical protein VHY20_10340 [Pirellulales bacterium]|jgi:hypothetical protein|nr:hypothetical protein [Pirellulales bacterium]